jgi:hypothetical protein
MYFQGASPRPSRRRDAQVEPAPIRSVRPRLVSSKAGVSLEWMYQGGLPTLGDPSGCKVENCSTLPFAHERSCNLAR